jgi:hypothetical protein
MLSLFSGRNGVADESPQPVNYDSFKIILDRNIFDPNRSSRSHKTSPPEKPKEVETINLLGTMSYEQGSFAFIESNNPPYNQTVREGEKFSNCTVGKIFLTHLILTAGEKEIRWPVGAKIYREDQGNWKLADIPPSSLLTHNPGSNDYKEKALKRIKSKENDIVQDITSFLEADTGEMLNAAYEKLINKFNKRAGEASKPEKQTKQNSMDRPLRKLEKFTRKMGMETPN